MVNGIKQGHDLNCDRVGLMRRLQGNVEEFLIPFHDARKIVAYNHSRVRTKYI